MNTERPTPRTDAEANKITAFVYGQSAVRPDMIGLARTLETELAEAWELIHQHQDTIANQMQGWAQTRDELAQRKESCHKADEVCLEVMRERDEAREELARLKDNAVQFVCGEPCAEHSGTGSPSWEEVQAMSKGCQVCRHRELARANLALATLNDMVCGDDGPRGNGATIRATRQLLNAAHPEPLPRPDWPGWLPGPANGGGGTAGPCTEKYPSGQWWDGDQLLVVVDVRNNVTGEEWMEYHAIRILCDEEFFRVEAMDDGEDIGWGPQSWSWYMPIPNLPATPPPAPEKGVEG